MNSESPCGNAACAQFNVNNNNFKKMPSSASLPARPVLVIPEGHNAESIAALLIDVMERKAEEAEDESDRLCLLRAKEILLQTVGDSTMRARAPKKHRRTVCGQFPSLDLTASSYENRDKLDDKKKSPGSSQKEVLQTDDYVNNQKIKDGYTMSPSCTPEICPSGEPAKESSTFQPAVSDADLSLHSYGLNILEATEKDIRLSKQERSLKRSHEESSDAMASEKLQPNNSADGVFRLVKRSCSERESSDPFVKRSASGQNPENPCAAQKDISTNGDVKNPEFHGHILLRGNVEPRKIPLERTVSDVPTDPRLKSMMLERVKQLASVARSLVVANVFRKIVKPLLPRNASCKEPASSITIEEIASDTLPLGLDGGNSRNSNVTEPPVNFGKVKETSEAAMDKLEETTAVSEQKSAAMEIKQETNTEDEEPTAGNGGEENTTSTGLLSNNGISSSFTKDLGGVLPMDLDVVSNDNGSDMELVNKKKPPLLPTPSMDVFGKSKPPGEVTAYPTSCMQIQPVVTMSCYPHLIASNEQPVWGYAHWQQTWTGWSMDTNSYNNQHYGQAYYPTMLPPQPWSNMQDSAVDSETSNSWNTSNR